MRSAFRAAVRPLQPLRRRLPTPLPLALGRGVRPAPPWAAHAQERRFSAEAQAAPAAASGQEPVPEDGVVPPPTQLQLRRIFVGSAVPFVAFGIVDQSVLIWAGDTIDNTVGVCLGLPTLAAAAMGQVLSDTCGVTFGGAIETFCLKLGLPLPGLTDAQQRLGVTKRVSTFGGVCGVIVGCLIGMLNLLVIDLQASERAKKAKELESIMTTVMADGRSSLSCERATLWVVDEAAGELWSSVAHGVEGILRVNYKTASTVAGWVAVNKEIANVPDVKQDPRWVRGSTSASDFEPKSMLCAPVVRDDKTVAVIQLLNKKDGDRDIAFDGNDEKVIKMLCSHVSIFMEQLG
mmetsp:Transcript_46289/g.124360  ORF Transcript_46289/g.124360 Transcript_46289/m.124360 type:complete len:348 (-) Transcript_46289:139-1182(-)